MRTREVIRQLNEQDPSGELEVAVGNVDIFYIERLPAYYDGPLQVLKRSGKPCYDVTGAEVRRSGHKVSIRTLSIGDALHENPDLLVEGEAAYVKPYETVRQGVKRGQDGESVAATRLAAELLGFGAGCRDGGCELGGIGRTPGGQHTNGGCRCLTYKADGCTRRGPLERQALRAAIKAAADVLERDL